MNTNSRRPLGDDLIRPETIDQISKVALADRRARGEIMTYYLDGWVVREYPGQRIVRLASIGDYRAEDHPLEPCPS